MSGYMIYKRWGVIGLSIALSLSCDDQSDPLTPLMPSEPMPSIAGQQGGEEERPLGGESSDDREGGQSADESGAEAGVIVDPPEEECSPGTRSCFSDTENMTAELFCQSNGQWAIQPCASGFLCIDDRCQAAPEVCVEGALQCTGVQEVSVCENEQLTPLETCVDDLVCSRGRCETPECALAGERMSYLGCDYLAVDLPNAAFDPAAGSTRDAPLGIVVGNPSLETSLALSVYASSEVLATLVGERTLSQNFESQTVRSAVLDSNGQEVLTGFTQAHDLEVPPGGSARLLLPRRMGPLRRSSVEQSAYRVRSNRPMVVYQFSPYCCNFSVSNDASLLYPTTALGVRYRYVGVPFTNDNPVGLEAPPVIAVVAPEDETVVSVQLPLGASVASDQMNRVNGTEGMVTATLNRDEVLLLSGTFQAGREDDLSGALITANHPIAVFSAHVCSSYPERIAACDHLQEQLLPISTWGNLYHLVPPIKRGDFAPEERVYWKLMSAGGEVRVKFSVPLQTLMPSAPGFDDVPDCRQLLEGDDTVLLNDETPLCEFGTQAPVQVESTGPITILGVMSGQDSVPFTAQAGDPSIFILPPVRQYRSDYFFLTPETYANNYATLITTPQNILTLDGVAVDLTDATSILGGETLIKHIPIDRPGPHAISGTAPFGLLVYAYDDYVSYAYTGGLNLVKR